MKFYDSQFWCGNCGKWIEKRLAWPDRFGCLRCPDCSKKVRTHSPSGNGEKPRI